jgi:hypothetical protein
MLKAEVAQYRAMTKRASHIANHIAALQEDLADVTQQCFQSAKSLADANAYYRIAPHVIYSMPPLDQLTNNQVHHAHDFFDDPWANRPHHDTLLYLWCGTDDHNVEDCKPLTKCEYCGHWGHCSDFCRTPHDACSINEPCHIPREHARWGLYMCPSDVHIFHAKGPNEGVMLRPGCCNQVFGLMFSYRTADSSFSINDLISSPLPIVVARYFFTLPVHSPSFLLLPFPSRTFCSRSLYVPLPFGLFCTLPTCSG